AADRNLVIIAPRPSSPLSALAVYRLAPWGMDDLIEYLLKAHREDCASVMARLKTSGDLGLLEGIPELWTVVLDRMGRDESVVDVRPALRNELASRAGDSSARERLAALCLTSFRQATDPDLAPDHFAPTRGVPLAEDLVRLARHEPVRLLVAADRVAAIV